MKQYTIKIQLVELEEDSFHLFINGRWNGKKITLCLDTGASQSCFDLNFFKTESTQEIISVDEGIKVGIGDSNLKVKNSILNQLSIGRFKVPESSIILLDLHHINDAYQQLKIPTIAGILGSDFFTKHNAVIDYFHKTLTLNIL